MRDLYIPRCLLDGDVDVCSLHFWKPWHILWNVILMLIVGLTFFMCLKSIDAYYGIGSGIFLSRIWSAPAAHPSSPMMSNNGLLVNGVQSACLKMVDVLL
jgi:hypothetical protein